MAVLHTAPLVVPVEQPPIADGAVLVEDGVIRAVGERSDLERASRGAERREWSGVLTPGLVNAHTHLQYTSFAAVGAARHATYVDWSQRFVVEYEARQSDDWLATSLAGIEAGLAAGVTAYADVVTDAAAMGAIPAAGVAGVAYLEIIGVSLERWRDEVEARVTEVLTNAATSRAFRVGLSPHAPYSVDEPVLKEAVALARRLGVRLHVHLAESDTEDSYYRTGTGALAERVTMRVGRPWSVVARGGAGVGSAEFAHSVGVLGHDSHVAHGVYLDGPGRKLLADTSTYVALCPRSNLTVGVGAPPVADYLEEGGLIAVGTDSLGSNRSLDVLEDVALLRRLATEAGYEDGDLDRRLLEAATLGGAGAMGMEAVVGSLAAGKRADMAVFDLDATVASVEHDLVQHGAGRCVATLTAGVVRSRS